MKNIPAHNSFTHVREAAILRINKMSESERELTDFDFSPEYLDFFE